jgi:hypothetical protein
MAMFEYMIWPFLLLLLVAGHFLDRKSRAKQDDIKRTYEQWKEESSFQNQTMLKNQEKIIALLEQIRDKKTS